ncbi:MAG: hypothetical protein ACD_4C00253G0001 [uncultured bacterium (gcode 4)]|uniref:Uncharacterized protein n=1 Tax=uncultured bacterium (gcode 4) TaxID=1234023 RepID=K2G8S3_9BACT|nr:MAG: hypothetical protein ACD_4C00253G0001 [uncultured bacterium (gcode 4)]
MDNLEIFLKWIEILSLDSNFLSYLKEEFDKQTSGLWNSDKILQIYKKIIQNEKLYKIFILDKEFILIENQISENIRLSNINSDVISSFIDEEILYINTDKLKEEITDKNVIESILWVISEFWNMLETNFINWNYNQNNQLYIWLKNNPNLLIVIFLTILNKLKSIEYENYESIKTFFPKIFSNNQIYQYQWFRNQDEWYSEHLIPISIIAIFIEKNQRVYSVKQQNWWTQNVNILQIFGFVSSYWWDFTKYLDIISDFWLLYDFISCLEKSFASDQYKEKILTALIKTEHLWIDEFIDFSVLFSKYPTIKDEWEICIDKLWINQDIVYQKLISSDENNPIRKEVLKFIIENNKKYLTDDIKLELFKILKTRISNSEDIDIVFNDDDEFTMKLIEYFKKWVFWSSKFDFTYTIFWVKFIEKIKAWLLNQSSDTITPDYYLPIIDKILVSSDIQTLNTELLKIIKENIWNIDIEKFKIILGCFAQLKVTTEYLNELWEVIKPDISSISQVKILSMIQEKYPKKKYIDKVWLWSNITDFLNSTNDEENQKVYNLVLEYFK